MADDYNAKYTTANHKVKSKVTTIEQRHEAMLNA